MRKNIHLTGYGIPFLLLMAGCNFVRKSDKPNFIIFVADDAAWDDNEPYGNIAVKTPVISKMAAEGIIFNNMFLTTSSCSPSRSSIMTGLYPHCTGAQELHNPLPADKLIFPGELQKAGYYTVASGKWHLGQHRSEFDSIYGGNITGAENWLRAIRNRPKEKPFFMWFAAFDPHRDYQPNAIPVPHNPAMEKVPPFLPGNDSTRKDLALYYDEISRLDSNIGTVMKELKNQGVDENTMVIYLSDNGRPFPRCKTRLYDSGIKTPFIIRWPGKIKPGLECDNLTSSVDIAPTLCELAGVKIPEVFQGVSFAELLKNPMKHTNDYIVAEHNWHDYQAHERCIRTEKFLYVRNEFPELNASPPADAVRSITYQEMIRLYKQGLLDEKYADCFLQPRPHEELYYLPNDPNQMENIAEDPAFSSDLEKMRNLLDQWITETGDKVPQNPTPDKFDRWTGNPLK